MSGNVVKTCSQYYISIRYEKNFISGDSMHNCYCSKYMILKRLTQLIANFLHNFLSPAIRKSQPTTFQPQALLQEG